MKTDPPDPLDMFGSPVAVGDILCDERGQTFEVLETNLTILRERMVSVRPLRRRHAQRSYLRLRFALRLNEDSLRLVPAELRDLYRLLYETHARQDSRDALRQRKQQITGPANHLGRIVAYNGIVQESEESAS